MKERPKNFIMHYVSNGVRLDSRFLPQAVFVHFILISEHEEATSKGRRMLLVYALSSQEQFLALLLNVFGFNGAGGGFHGADDIA